MNKELGPEVSKERLTTSMTPRTKDRREIDRGNKDRRKTGRYMALRTIIFSGVDIDQARKQIEAIRSLGE